MPAKIWIGAYQAHKFVFTSKQNYSLYVRPITKLFSLWFAKKCHKIIGSDLSIVFTCVLLMASANFFSNGLSTVTKEKEVIGEKNKIMITFLMLPYPSNKCNKTLNYTSMQPLDLRFECLKINVTLCDTLWYSLTLFCDILWHFFVTISDILWQLPETCCQLSVETAMLMKAMERTQDTAATHRQRTLQ